MIQKLKIKKLLKKNNQISNLQILYKKVDYVVKIDFFYNLNQKKFKVQVDNLNKALLINMPIIQIYHFQKNILFNTEASRTQV